MHGKILLQLTDKRYKAKGGRRKCIKRGREAPVRNAQEDIVADLFPTASDDPGI